MIVEGHKVEEGAHGGAALSWATSDPMNGQADHRPANDGQIEGGGSVAHATAILAGRYVQAQVQARFNTPVVTIGQEHLLGTHLDGRSGAEQVFGVNALGRSAQGIGAAGQAGGLLDEGKVESTGRGVKSDEAARFGAAAVEFTGLGQSRRVQRGKKSAKRFGREFGVHGPHRAGCL